LVAVVAVLRGDPRSAEELRAALPGHDAVLFEDDGLLNAIARRTFLRNVARDSAEMERIEGASDLDWTIARPPRLTNGALTRAYGVADGRMPAGARLTISRADVADFLLEEVEHPAHLRRIVGLASVRAATRRAPMKTDADLISRS